MDQTTDGFESKDTTNSDAPAPATNSEAANGSIVSQVITQIESDSEHESKKITTLEKASFEPSIVQEQEWRNDRSDDEQRQNLEQLGQLEQLQPLEHLEENEQSEQVEQRHDQQANQANIPSQDDKDEKPRQEESREQENLKALDPSPHEDPIQSHEAPQDEESQKVENSQSSNLPKEEIPSSEQQDKKLQGSDQIQESTEPELDKDTEHQESLESSEQTKQAEVQEETTEPEPQKQPGSVQSENDIFDSCVLNTDAVDKHMEKVIDDIVQLDGCKQFAQELVEDEVPPTDVQTAVEKIEEKLSSPSPAEHLTKETSESQAQYDVVQADKQVPDLIDEKSNKQNTVPDPTTKQSCDEDTTSGDVDQREAEEAQSSREITKSPITQTDAKSSEEEPIEEPTINDDDKIESESHTASGDVVKRRDSSPPKADAKAEDESSNTESRPEADEEPRRTRPVRATRLRVSQPPPKEPEPSKAETKPKAKQVPSIKLKIQVDSPRRANKRAVVPSPPDAPVEPVVKSIRSSRSSNIAPLPAATKTQDNPPASSSRSRSLSSKHYECDQCSFATDRQNNIVLHKKSCCPGYKKIYEDYVDKLKQNLLSPKSNKKRSTR